MAEFTGQSFIDYMKNAEGFSAQLYDDVGRQAIGWGNNLVEGEDFTSGVSEAQANGLLAHDLGLAFAAARRATTRIDPDMNFDTLSRDTQYKLAERAFSMGPDFDSDFPLWSRAVIGGNTEVELAEHHRYSGGIPMKRRNQLYEDYFHGQGAAAEVGGVEEAGASGDAPASSMTDLLEDHQFRNMSPEQQTERAADVSPEFDQLRQEKPEVANQWLSDKVDEFDPDIWESLEGGFLQGIGVAQWTSANAAMLIEKLGLENDFDESWRKAADLNFLDAEEKIGSDWYDQVAAILGGLPGGLAIPGAATAALFYGLPALGVGAGATAVIAPMAGFGLSGALAKADEGPEAALRRGAIDAALGLLYPATAHLGRVSRVGVEGTAAWLVSEEEDPVRRGIEALALGTIAGTPGRRAPFEVMEKLGVRNRPKEQRAALVEARRVAEANVQSVAAMKMPVSDMHGNPIAPTHSAEQGRSVSGLQSAYNTYNQMITKDHPMMQAMPQERPPWQRKKHENRVKESMEDTRPLVVKKTKEGDIHEASTEWNPGPEHVDNRVFSLDDHVARSIFGKTFKKAGELMAPVLAAFKIPIKAGTGTKGRKPGLMGPLGWYQSKSRDMRLRDRPDVQTMSHEFAHDLSFRDPELLKLHEGAKVQVDVDTISNILRLKNIDVSDVGPAMNDMFQLWKKGDIPVDIAYIPELASVSYDRNSLTEGVAEMFRLWFTNNRRYGGAVDIGSKFPSMSKIMEDWKTALPRNQRKAIEQFQKDAHAHLDMDGAAAYAARLGPDADPSAVLSTRMARFRDNYTDDLSGIYNLEMQTFGRIIPNGAYESARLLRGLGEAADNMVYFGVPTWVPDSAGGRMIRYEGDGIAQIFGKHGINTGSKIDSALRYTTMRQADELMGQSITPRGDIVDLNKIPEALRAEIETSNQTRERLFTREQIDSGLRLAERHPEYKLIFNDLKKFADNMADFGEGAGLWSRSQRGTWKRAEFVFSFFREMGENPHAGRKGGDGPATRMLRGSDRNLRDPFQNLMETHARTFKLSMENVAKQKILEVVTRAQGGGRFGEIITPIAKMKDFRVTNMRDAFITQARKLHPKPEWMNDTSYRNMIDELIDRVFLNKKKLKAKIERGDPLLTPAQLTAAVKDQMKFKDAEWLERLTMYFGDMTPQGADVMTVYRGGKPTYYRINDPVLMNSLQAFRRPQLLGVEKWWNNMRRLKQRFITMAPGFIAANFARDVAMASIMSKTGNFHLWKSIGGLWSALRKDQAYQDYIANGGGAAGVSDTMGAVRQKMIRHAQRTGFNPKRLMIDTVSVHRMLSHLSSATELASRVGEYKAARKQGDTARHAAYMGREVATDFGMRGSNRVMNFMSNTIPFFNAMVEGGDKLGRSVFADGMHGAATGAKIGLVAVAGMGLYEINRRIPQFMDLPDWDKNGYWHFFVPAYNEEGERMRVPEGRFAGQLDYTHFKMPKIWEVGSISSIGERMMESMYSDEDEDTVELVTDLSQLILQNFGVNPYDKSFPVPVPAGLDIVVEQFSNRIMFTGNPIESQAMANYETWRRRRPSQATVYGEWGKLMQDVPAPDVLKSPARAEALLRGIFGEFANMGAALADSILYPGGPEKRLDQMPVVSRFYEGPEKYSRQEQEFYERFTEVKQAHGTMRQMAGNPAEVKDLEKWVGDPVKVKLVGLKDTFARQVSYVAELNRYISLINEGGLRYTPQRARIEIDKTKSTIREVMAAMNRVARDIERSGP